MGRRTAAAGDSAPAGDARPIFFLRHQKENAPRPVEKKTCSAGRPAQAQPSCRRRGKVGNPARRSETETPGPWGTLQPGDVRDTSSFSFRCRWPVVDESLRSGPMRASASTTAQAARSEAERAERGAGQMRPCTPTQDAPAPRESAIKPVPHPAAPVGEPSQTRRHHLTPTPVQQLCTHVQSCDQKRFFLFHRARRILFLSRTKREWGAHPPWKRPPGGSQIPRPMGRTINQR